MISRFLTIILVGIFSLPLVAWGQLFPHIKTFGYDYGYPRTVENLQFAATHHDMIIGAGEWQSNKISIFQYDTMKDANSEVILIPYTVIQAFTFELMLEHFKAYVTAHAGDGYVEEDLYIHYYNDQIVRMRTEGTATSGTGTPFDYICDSSGNLLADGAKGVYYISLGYGGPTGSATTLAEARTYQYWNAGFEPRMNHQSAAWQGAYKSYILDVITVDADNNKYADGVYLDTFVSVVDQEGFLPNIPELIEVREHGSFSAIGAKQFLSQVIADMLEETRIYIEAQTPLDDFLFIMNGGDMGYLHGTYSDVRDDFVATVEKGFIALEYITSPSKIRDAVYPLWKEHLDVTDNYPSVDHMDISWYNYGQNDPPKPSLGSKQFLYGTHLLFNNEYSFYGTHYYTPARYGPGVYPNIGEANGGKFEESHWDEMMKYDLGAKVDSGNADYWGGVGTLRPYTIDPIRKGYWADGHEYPGRTVWRQKYENGLVILIGERTDDNPDDNGLYNPDLQRSGGDPVEYDLGDDYCRLNVRGEPDGNVVRYITLGAAHAAVMVNASLCTGLPPVDPECNFNGIEDGLLETGIDCGGGVCPDCIVDPDPNPLPTIMMHNATIGGVPVIFTE